MQMQHKMAKFFDELAAGWDARQQPWQAPVIREILGRAGFNAQDQVLDVACGTGVLIPFFLECGLPATQITAIDIAAQMVSYFSQKFPTIRVVHADFEQPVFAANSFTKVIIFNAFPHFQNIECLLAHAYDILQEGGRFIIAHSRNRSAMNLHHHQAGGPVKNHILIADEDIQTALTNAGFSHIVISDDAYFYAHADKVTGIA